MLTINEQKPMDFSNPTPLPLNLLFLTGIGVRQFLDMWDRTYTETTSRIGFGLEDKLPRFDRSQTDQY